MPEESSRLRKSEKKRLASSDSSSSRSPARSLSVARSVSPQPETKKSREDRSRKTKRSKSKETSKLSTKVRDRRDSAERKISRPDKFSGDKSRLYVGDLLPHLGEEDLRVLFSPHGDLVEVSIQQKSQDNGLKFGFVQFRTAEQAARAIRNLSDVTIDNQPVKIELARPKKRDLEREQPQPRSSRTPAFDAQAQMMAMSQMWPGFAAMQGLGFGALPGMANWAAQTQTYSDSNKSKHSTRSRSRDRDRRRGKERGVQIEVSDVGKRTVHRGDNSPGRKREESERWKPLEKTISRRSSKSRSPDRKKTKRSRSRSSSVSKDSRVIVINNLSRKVSSEDLRSKLERFGKIRSLDFQQKEGSRGSATIVFSSVEAAERVLKEDPIFVNNKRLNIQGARPGRAGELDQDDEDIVPQRLHVRNLAFSTSPKSLKQYFKQFGDVEEAWVVDDPKTGRSKGVGFVEFKSQEGAARAMQEESHELDGRPIRTHFAKISAEFNIGQGLSATRLHLSNLPREASAKEIRKYFAKFGNIADLYLVPEKEGKIPAGFVEFSTHKEAASCVRVTRHLIGDTKVTVTYARLRAGENVPAPISAPISSFPSVFNTPMSFPNMSFFPSMMPNPFLFPPRLGNSVGGTGLPFSFPGLVPPSSVPSSKTGRSRGLKN